MKPEEERTWSMLAHLSSLLGLAVAGMGFWVGPLVIWLVFKDKSATVGAAAKEALNFQITLLIAGIIGGILTLVLVGFAVLAVVFIAGIVFPIIAAVKSNEGQAYRYPFALRLIS